MSDIETKTNQLIGARIRAIRQSQRLSQAALAEKAHLSLPLISSIELGKSTMLVTTLLRIIEALQVSADELLRPDVPSVNGIYQNEFAGLLSGCTPEEIESIIKIVKELIETMHTKKDDYSDF